jgi:hypothetical protein
MISNILPVQEQSSHICDCDNDCRCNGKGWYTTYKTV